MPLASEVAADLRKLADCLDSNPQAEVKKPWVFFTHSTEDDKPMFFALAKLFPRPFKKSDGYAHNKVVLDHDTEFLDVRSEIPKSLTCRLITPATEAVYECEPLLSVEEDAALEAA